VERGDERAVAVVHHQRFAAADPSVGDQRDDLRGVQPSRVGRGRDRSRGGSGVGVPLDERPGEGERERERGEGEPGELHRSITPQNGH
jgi:hypothetical protein